MRVNEGEFIISFIANLKGTRINYENRSLRSRDYNNCLTPTPALAFARKRGGWGVSFLNKIRKIVDSLYYSISASNSDMQKDFKIGLIIGLILVIAALIWLSTLSSVSITSRFRNIQNAQTSTIQGIMNSSTAPKPAGSPSAPSQNRPAKPVSQQDVQTKTPADNKITQTETTSDQRFHIVLRGQTLSDIAKQYYGAASKWPKIKNANPSIDPNRLQPGTRLLIPP